LQAKNILISKIKPWFTAYLVRGTANFLWQMATSNVVGWFSEHA
jgi:hypothetical protein